MYIVTTPEIANLPAAAEEKNFHCWSPIRFVSVIADPDWAYTQVENVKGQVWLKGSAFFHLGPTWRELLVA